MRIEKNDGSFYFLLKLVELGGGEKLAEGDIEAEIKRMAEEHKVEEERVRAVVNVEDMKKDLASQKALELVKASVKKPTKKTTKKASDKEEEKTEEKAD